MHSEAVVTHVPRSDDAKMPAIPMSNRKLAIFLPMIVLVNCLDMVVPPAGIPAAVLLLWLVLRRNGAGWADIGLGRPRSWPRTILTGVLITAAMWPAITFGLEPLVQRLTGEVPDMSRFEGFRGNVGQLATYLTVSWTTAGMGEEILWRGWATGAIAAMMGARTPAWVASLVITSILFGSIHLYQGPAGMIMTGLIGFTFGAFYLLTRRLWLSMLVHALFNSVSFIALFLGLNV